MYVDVAVIVVTFNSEQVIQGLLDSLTPALAGLTSSVVIVDNGSQDDTMHALAKSSHPIQVIRSTNTGYAAGINLGVSKAPRSDSLLILNPDVVLAPGSVRALFDTFSDQSVGVVAPRLIDSTGHLSKSQRRAPSILRSIGLGFTGIRLFSEIVVDQEAYATATNIDWATGAVLLVRRSCYDGLGGWDSTFFLYSEETDFCLRARDQGWIVRFQPAATATHIAGASGRSGRTQAMQALNQVRLYRRRHSVIAAWVFYIVTILAELSRTVRRRPHSTQVLRALLLKKDRPQELGLSDNMLPSDRG